MSSPAPIRPFSHIDCWIFDLDNTLYHPRHRLFDQMDRRMESFISELLGCDAEAARRVQKQYFHRHGTTLAGLMHEHRVEPDVYLAFVHDIVLDALEPEPGLAAALAALPGRRIVFTNADAPHAGRVLARLGLDDVFDAIHDIRACNFVPKPAHAGYDLLCDVHGIEARRAVMVEDMARNLAPAKALGMTTVWVDNGSEAGGRDHDPAVVDHRIDDLATWLQGVVAHEITGTASR